MFERLGSGGYYHDVGAMIEHRHLPQTADQLGTLGRLQEIAEVDNVRVCRWGSLLVQSWEGDPTCRARAAVAEAIEVMTAESAGPRGAFSMLNLVRPPRRSGHIDLAQRENTKAVMARLGGVLRAHATVLDAGGITGAALRVFMSSLSLVSRPEVPARMFSSLDRALEWLLHNEGVDRALVREVRLLRTGLTLWWGPRGSY